MFYIFPIIIYFPRLLPGVETQPILMAVVAIWALLFGPNSRPRVLFTLLTAVLGVLCLLRMSAGLGVNNSLTLIQILIGPLFFFGAAAAQAPPPSRPALRAITIIFLGVGLLEIIAPTIYLSIGSLLLDRVTVTDGHRGVSFLTPEPTYAAISVVYLFLLTIWSRQTGDRRFSWIEPLQFILLMMTLSTYSVIFILLLVIFRWPRIAAISTLALLLFYPSLSFLGREDDQALRFMVAITSIMATDFSALLPSLSLLDSSLGSRLLSSAASFQTPGFAPLGLGLDCNAIPTAFEQLNYSFAFNNEVISQVVADGCLKPQSYGATVFLGLGYMAIPFIIVLGITTYQSLLSRQRTKIWKPALAISLLMLIVQAQLSSPIPWMLLFLATSRYYPRSQTKHITLIDA